MINMDENDIFSSEHVVEPIGLSISMDDDLTFPSNFHNLLEQDRVDILERHTIVETNDHSNCATCLDFSDLQAQPADATEVHTIHVLNFESLELVPIQGQKRNNIAEKQCKYTWLRDADKGKHLYQLNLEDYPENAKQIKKAKKDKNFRVKNTQLLASRPTSETDCELQEKVQEYRSKIKEGKITEEQAMADCTPYLRKALIKS